MANKGNLWSEENIINVLGPFSIFDTHILVVRKHKTGENTWNYTSGLLYEKEVYDAIGFEKAKSGGCKETRNYPQYRINRNYSSFWHLPLEAVNGKRYLLCGEDYQSLTMIGLTDGDRFEYTPNRGKYGSGWCHYGTFLLSPSKKYLAAYGCVWAGPGEVKIYDIREPQSFPWPVVLYDISLDEHNKDHWHPTEDVFQYRSDPERWVGEGDEDDATDEEYDDPKNWAEIEAPKIWTPK